MPSEVTTQSSPSSFFQSRFNLPEKIRLPNSAELLHKSASRCVSYDLEQSEQVEAIKRCLYKEHWLHWIVSKFPYLPANQYCFVSHHRYHQDLCEETLAMTSAEQFISDLKYCFQVINDDNPNQPKHLKLSSAVRRINIPDVSIVCVLTKNDALDFNFSKELKLLESIVKASREKRVIPITIDSTIDECLPSQSNELIEHTLTSQLSYSSQLNEYEYSEFFADLLGTLGKLNDVSKSAFKQFGEDLKKKISDEFGDDEILASIDIINEQRTEIRKRVMQMMRGA